MYTSLCLPQTTLEHHLCHKRTLSVLILQCLVGNYLDGGSTLVQVTSIILAEYTYRRRQTRPQQIIIKQTASPAKITATIAAAVSEKYRILIDITIRLTLKSYRNIEALKICQHHYFCLSYFASLVLILQCAYLKLTFFYQPNQTKFIKSRRTNGH